jgi:hypothetical protein
MRPSLELGLDRAQFPQQLPDIKLKGCVVSDFAMF